MPRKNDCSFSREDTKKVKGFAIMAMLLHHLFAFPARIAGGGVWSFFGPSNNGLISLLGNFCKICVPLFLFLGGYGIYIQAKNKKYTILSSIKKLYLAYWKVFIIFIPIAFLLFSNQIAYCGESGIYSKYNHFSLLEVVRNFLGVSSTLQPEWWFLSAYVVAIISFPLWKYIFNKISAQMSVLLVVAVCLAMQYIFPAIGSMNSLGSMNRNYLYRVFLCQDGCFYACFLIGMLFAKYNWLAKAEALLREHFKINLVTSLIAIAAMVVLRQKVTGQSLDMLYAPAITICVTVIAKSLPVIGRMLMSIGKHSTTMWLTHTFWCYYFYPVVQVVVWPRYAIVCYIVLLAISYTFAFLFDGFWVLISRAVAKSPRGRSAKQKIQA